MRRRHSSGRSVQCTPEDERRLCDTYNAGRAAKAARKAAYSPSPASAPATPAGNVAVHYLEAQGGEKSYKEAILDFAERSNCDTIITLSCHQNLSYQNLRKILEPIVHRAQNTYSKRRNQYVDVAFYVEQVPGNLHVHGLLSFPSDELRQKFVRLFPLTDSESKQKRRELALQQGRSSGTEENKCGYWTHLCESGTYDLQVMNDRSAAISYCQKAQSRNADFKTVIYSVDFVSSPKNKKPKARYPKKAR